MEERLQKFLANAGIASRRKCEEYIKDGKVSVNGNIITELGFKVTNKDVILFNGKPIVKKEHIYYLINKPSGIISSTKDNEGKKSVIDLIDEKERIYPIGRLDYNVSGALILTNDGDLAYKLTKNSYKIKKVYQVRIKGIINQANFNKLYKGFKVNDKTYRDLDIELLNIDKEHESSLLKITLNDTKNNDIYKIFEALGYEVKKIKRLEFAGISIDDMAAGEYRKLKVHEIRKLYSL